MLSYNLIINTLLKKNAYPVLLLYFMSWISALPAQAYYIDQPASFVIGQNDFNSNTSGCTSRNLSSPYGTFWDGNKLFIADRSNNRVLIYNQFPIDPVNTPADIVLGQPNMLSNTANYDGISNRSLNQPRFVLSTGNKLLVSDTANNRILIFNTVPTQDYTPADHVIGQADFTSGTPNRGNTNPAATTLAGPMGMHYNGNLFVADYFNNRVLVYTSIPTSSGAAAAYVIGQDNFASREQATDQNSLFGPISVFAIPSTSFSLMISDTENNRVLYFPDFRNNTATKVIGQIDFTSNLANQGGTNPTASTLYQPHGVSAIDDRLCIADWRNNRVLLYNNIVPTQQFDVAANMVIGQSDFTSKNNSVVAANKLNNPTGLQGSPDGLIMGDTGNHRVLFHFDMTPTYTATISPTPTATMTPTHTSTISPTHSSTVTPTITPTISPTVTTTSTTSPTPTITKTGTVTATKSVTASLTATASITPFLLNNTTVITYPSPATGDAVWFYYRLEASSEVKIEIFNVAGEPVTVLHDSHPGNQDYARTLWPISTIASGMYLYRLTISDAHHSRKLGPKKLILIK